MSTLAEPVAPAGAGTDVQLTYREAINAALEDEMAADDAVILMGEDVDADGGVFKTNIGLVEKFGKARVRSTPICENGFMGVALGMSLAGLRPVVEIMFSDFMPTAGDAIVNQLPKYRYMSGGQFSVPVTVRSIGGALGRFGTQHSATGESWFMSLPGLRVVTASSPGAAYELLRAAIRDANPVIFHEHKAMYARKGTVRRGAVAEVGKAAVLREGTDVTIVATLLMVERALKAADDLAGEGISAEVIDLRWVRPLDLATVAASVAKTGRLVIAEEQVHAGGWGATIISELTMRGQAWTSPPRAVGLPADIPIPYSPPLEDSVIPSAELIADAVRATLGR
jgi:pyruvate/2-oxoglutarate/acetoin dehydrogenase E1 component